MSIKESGETTTAQKTEPKVEKKTEAKTDYTKIKGNIEKIYRVKEYGKQYLYFVIEGNPHKQGINLVPTFRKYKNWETQKDGVTKILVEREDPTMVVSTTRQYDIEFSKPVAKALVERGEKEAKSLQLHLVEGRRNAPCSAKNFIDGNFDDLLKEVRAGNSIQ